jgi:hypothetical protein
VPSNLPSSDLSLSFLMSLFSIALLHVYPERPNKNWKTLIFANTKK